METIVKPKRLKFFLNGSFFLDWMQLFLVIKERTNCKGAMKGLIPSDEWDVGGITCWIMSQIYWYKASNNYQIRSRNLLLFTHR
jgi:hypothetical protein